MTRSKKPWPTLPTDEVAEAFVESADLSEYDWAAAEPVSYEREEKDARVTVRMPQRQLDALKKEAERRGIRYQRLMREYVERGLNQPRQS